jgi:hypothetical protein
MQIFSGFYIKMSKKSSNKILSKITKYLFLKIPKNSSEIFLKIIAYVKKIQFLSNFALLLEEVGSQTVGPPYRYQYQQLTLQHGLKMDGWN